VHRTDSDDIYWWLPVIGPTATVLAHTLARYTATGGATWDTGEFANRIGLSGIRSRLWDSLNRLDIFGVAHFHATDVLTIRLTKLAISRSRPTSGWTRCRTLLGAARACRNGGNSPTSPPATSNGASWQTFVGPGRRAG
jgi:hypothetical protein